MGKREDRAYVEWLREADTETLGEVVAEAEIKGKLPKELEAEIRQRLAEGSVAL